MGVSPREITSALIEHGADPAIPMALTRWATMGVSAQLKELGSMADIAEKEHFKSPAVAVLEMWSGSVRRLTGLKLDSFGSAL